MIKYKDHRDEYTSSMQGLTMLLTIIVYIVYLLFHRNINEFIDMTTLLVIVYLVLGIGIGALGSSISMRKYLQV